MGSLPFEILCQFHATYRGWCLLRLTCTTLRKTLGDDYFLDNRFFSAKQGQSMYCGDLVPIANYKSAANILYELLTHPYLNTSNHIEIVLHDLEIKYYFGVMTFIMRDIEIFKLKYFGRRHERWEQLERRARSEFYDTNVSVGDFWIKAPTYDYTVPFETIKNYLPAIFKLVRKKSTNF